MPPSSKLSLVPLVCPYLFWVCVLVLYFATVMFDITHTDDRPSSFILPKLLFVISVAILVERRAGYASILKRPSTIVYKIILSLTACNIALALVWDQVERAVYFILVPVSMVVEALTSTSMRCDTCHGLDDLHYLVTTVIAGSILVWVLHSLVSLTYIQRNISNCFLKKPLVVKFWAIVEVRFINPNDHHPVHPTKEQLKDTSVVTTCKDT